MSATLDAAAVAFTGAVHPLAELFPPLPDDTLADLAADIGANGLRQSVVLTPNGTLLDGRNRLAACERAGVAPRFTTHDGDPAAYIISANINRRHLNPGQRAMLVAKVRVSSGNTMRAAAEAGSVSASNVSKATTVLEADPDLADAVIAGERQLTDAYREVKQRQAGPEAEPADDTLPAVHGDGRLTRGRIAEDGQLREVGTGAIVFDPEELRAAEAEDARAEKPKGKKSSAKPQSKKVAKPTAEPMPELIPERREPEPAPEPTPLAEAIGQVAFAVHTQGTTFIPTLRRQLETESLSRRDAAHYADVLEQYGRELIDFAAAIRAADLEGTDVE